MKTGMISAVAGAAICAVGGYCFLSQPARTVRQETTSRPLSIALASNPVVSEFADDAAGQQAEETTRPAIHWSSAPYLTEDDVFACIIQPRRALTSDTLASISEREELAEVRDAAAKIDWIAIYGQKLESELDLASRITLVVKQAEPTTLADFVSGRFQGREVTEELVGNETYLRVAPAVETVLISRVDAEGINAAVETTVQQDAVAVYEYDPSTYLIIREDRLAAAIAQAPCSSAVKDQLVSLRNDIDLAFVSGNGNDRVLEMICRVGGDQSHLLAAPVLSLLGDLTCVRLEIGLDRKDLIDGSLTFSDEEKASSVSKSLVSLRDRALPFLAGTFAGTESGQLNIGQLLLQKLEISAQGSSLQLRLPRPERFAEMLRGDTPQVTSTLSSTVGK